MRTPKLSLGVIPMWIDENEIPRKLWGSSVRQFYPFPYIHTIDVAGGKEDTMYGVECYFIHKPRQHAFILESSRTIE